MARRERAAGRLVVAQGARLAVWVAQLPAGPRLQLLQLLQLLVVPAPLQELPRGPNKNIAFLELIASAGCATLGFTRFSGHFHLASKPPLKLGRTDVTQR